MRIRRRAPIKSTTDVGPSPLSVLGRGAQAIGGQISDIASKNKKNKEDQVDADREFVDRSMENMRTRVEREDAKTLAMMTQRANAISQQNKAEHNERIAIAKAKEKAETTVSNLKRTNEITFELDQFASDDKIQERIDNGTLAEMEVDLLNQYNSYIEDAESKMDPIEFADFMSKGADDFRRKLETSSHRISRVRGEQAKKEVGLSIASSVSDMTPSNIDDITASAYNKTADFTNVDGRGEMIDTAIKQKMTDMMFDASIPVEERNQASKAETFNRLFNQKEKNSFREFNQRQSAAADVAMIETELSWQRESVDEVKAIMDNGGVLQDVTSIFEAKGYTPARVKAVTDMAAKYIPKGEVFDESKMTPDEKYKRLTHELAVQEGFSVVGGNISKLRSMDFDTRDKDKIKERNATIGTIRDSLTAHFMLLEQSKDSISRNKYIKEGFKNISAQSDLFDIVSTAENDTVGGRVKKSNDSKNAIKLLGLRADAIETGIMSEGYSAPERQAMANRLRMEGIRAYSDGEQFIMNSEDDATAFVKAFEKETINEIDKNPDAYDLMMASKADTQWQPPSDQDMIDEIAYNIETGNNPRKDTINALTGMGITPERAEQVYQQYAPRAFEKVMIKQNRTPEQVGLDTLHDDLKDFVKRVPDAEVVTPSVQDTPSGSINRDAMDAGGIQSTGDFDAESELNNRPLGDSSNRSGSSARNSGAESLILREEGEKKVDGEHVAFKDDAFKKGAVSGGIGHLMSKAEKKKYPVGTPIPQEQVDKWFKQDLEKAEKAATKKIDGFTELPAPVQSAIVSLAFQVGEGQESGSTGLAGFKNTIKILEERPFTGDVANRAADEMLDSKWAKNQTPARAKRAAKLVRESI